MKKHTIIKRAWIMTILALSISLVAAGKTEPVSLSPEGKKLEAHYGKMLADLQESIMRLEPKVDEKKKAEFTKLLGELENAPPVTKVVMGTEREVKYGPGNPAFAEKQKEALTAARAVMKDIDAFLGGEEALATMARFALLTHATPERLAEFAQQGVEEKALIDQLLNDDKLVVQAMTLGGASGGNYGQAMRNYTAIWKASELLAGASSRFGLWRYLFRIRPIPMSIPTFPRPSPWSSTTGITLRPTTTVYWIPPFPNWAGPDGTIALYSRTLTRLKISSGSERCYATTAPITRALNTGGATAVSSNPTSPIAAASTEATCRPS